MALSKNQKSILKKLRKEGLSYREIRDKVDFSVSLGTLSNLFSDLESQSKCELDISPKEFHSIFREKAQEERGHYLMRNENGTYVETLLNNKEDFEFVKKELEKFIS